jgi:hypothetical protein
MWIGFHGVAHTAPICWTRPFSQVPQVGDLPP